MESIIWPFSALRHHLFCHLSRGVITPTLLFASSNVLQPGGQLADIRHVHSSKYLMRDIFSILKVSYLILSPTVGMIQKCINGSRHSELFWLVQLSIKSINIVVLCKIVSFQVECLDAMMSINDKFM